MIVFFLLFLAFISLLFIYGVGRLVYIILKGKKIYPKILLGVIAIAILSLIIYQNACPKVFSKSDVENIFKQSHLELTRDFTILSHTWDGGGGFSMHPERLFENTKIKIDSADKNKLIQQIVNSPNLCDTAYARKLGDSLFSDVWNDRASEIVCDCERENDFCRSVYTEQTNHDGKNIDIVVYKSGDSVAIYVQSIE